MGLKAKWVLMRLNGSGPVNCNDEARAMHLIEKKGYRVVGGVEFKKGRLPGHVAIAPERMVLPRERVVPAVDPVPKVVPVPVPVKGGGKECAHCGEPFKPKVAVQKYCGPDCAKEARKSRK